MGWETIQGQSKGSEEVWEDVTGETTFELGLQIGVFQAEEGGNHVALRRVYVWGMEGGVKAESP